MNFVVSFWAAQGLVSFLLGSERKARAWKVGFLFYLVLKHLWHHVGGQELLPNLLFLVQFELLVARVGRKLRKARRI